MLLACSIYCVKLFDYYTSFSGDQITYEFNGYTLFQDQNNPDYNFKMRYLGDITDTGKFKIYFEDPDIRNFIVVLFLNAHTNIFEPTS